MNNIRQSFFIPRAALTEKTLPDQIGKVFIITGGYSGVGLALSKIIYQRNGTVYIAGRSRGKADNAITNICNSAPTSRGRIEFLFVDFADLKTIRKCAEEFMNRESRLDVLVNNAGVMLPPAGSKTAQGFEQQIGTNCLGPFLLTQCLLPILKRTSADSGPGSVRVTWAGSLAIDMYAPSNGIEFDGEGNVRNFQNQNTNYGQSKAANYLLSIEMAKRYRGDGIVSVAWNPGNLKTDLQRDFGKVRKMIVNLMLYPAINGAYTQLFAGWSHEIGIEQSGSYIIPWGRFGKVRADVEAGAKGISQGEVGTAEKLWQWCESKTQQY